MRSKPYQILLTREGIRFPSANSAPIPQYKREYVEIPLLHWTGEPVEWKIDFVNQKQMGDAKDIIADEKLGEPIWETWDCFSFYCESVSWDGKKETLQCAGDGSEEAPFLNVNYALEVIYCIVSRTCFTIPVILHVSGVVDYPVFHRDSFKGCLIVDGGNFENKLPLKNSGYYSDLNIQGVHLFNVKYTQSIESKSVTCDGVFEHSKKVYVPVTLWKCSFKNNLEEPTEWSIGNLVESEVDATYSSIMGYSSYRSVCKAFSFLSVRLVYIDSPISPVSNFPLPTTIKHSEMILGKGVVHERRVNVFDCYFVLDSTINCDGGAFWQVANATKLNIRFTSEDYNSGTNIRSFDIRGKHTFASNLNISAVLKFTDDNKAECIGASMNLFDVQRCDIHIENCMIYSVILNMMNCHTTTKGWLMAVEQWPAYWWYDINFELENESDWLLDYVKIQNNTFDLNLDLEDQVSELFSLGNAHNNTFNIKSNSSSVDCPVSFKYYKKNTHVSRYFNNNKTTVVMSGESSNGTIYVTSDELHRALQHCPVGRYNYSFTATLTKPVRYFLGGLDSYVYVELLGTNPMCNSGAVFQYLLGEEPYHSSGRVIRSEEVFPTYNNLSKCQLGCNVGTSVRVEKIRRDGCNGLVDMIVDLYETIHTGSEIIYHRFSGYPVQDSEKHCLTGEVRTEYDETSTEPCSN